MLSDILRASHCRFWHDERRFKGGADKCLVQQALFAAGELQHASIRPAKSGQRLQQL
jgi:hypothetical protein